MSPTESLLVVREIRAIDPAIELDETLDLVVEQGRIKELGRDAGKQLLDTKSARIIDGRGKWLLPGLIDIHTHLREPGHEYKEDIESGLKAAAAGGYTHICVMPNTRPVNDTRSVTELMLRRASLVGGTKLHPIGAITMGLKGTQLTEMAELKDAGVVAVSDDGLCVMNAAVMRRALEYAKNFDLPVMQHAEDHHLTEGADMHEGEISAKLGLRGWPRVAEDIIVARDLLLAEYTGAHYHVAHISTQGTVRMLREAKDRGIRATCEVTPHHLLLTDANVIGYDTHCKVNPPLREREDAEALIEALADGTIDAIATDHAPHSPLEKDCEFSRAAPGMMGLELCFPLLLGLVQQGRVPLARLLDAMSTRPAQVVGLPPPRLAVNEDAHFVIADPDFDWRPNRDNLHTKSLNSPFMKQKLKGRVLFTCVGREIAYDMLNHPAPVESSQ